MEKLFQYLCLFQVHFEYISIEFKSISLRWDYFLTFYQLFRNSPKGQRRQFFFQISILVELFNKLRSDQQFDCYKKSQKGTVLCLDAF